MWLARGYNLKLLGMALCDQTQVGKPKSNGDMLLAVDPASAKIALTMEKSLIFPSLDRVNRPPDSSSEFADKH